MSNDFTSLDAGKLDWRRSKVAEGVMVKDLGHSDGQRMQLVHFEPGACFPMHKHAGPEFIYVLEGEAIQRGVRLGPGCVGIAAKDTEEDDFHSDIGCTFLLVFTE